MSPPVAPRAGARRERARVPRVDRSRATAPWSRARGKWRGAGRARVGPQSGRVTRSRPRSCGKARSGIRANPSRAARPRGSSNRQPPKRPNRSTRRLEPGLFASWIPFWRSPLPRRFQRSPSSRRAHRRPQASGVRKRHREPRAGPARGSRAGPQSAPPISRGAR